ncbi:hypothetical protein C3K47_15970 [Solitalea longa]|uniref:DUF5723 domain-containing protein n=1 Tax=Solitalea longa TaxID=2079460 RepID=A0A2S4ZZ06_9SPHI|nr:DUF6588 family protein [Solitalea longa]POY35279.1 hypothetical protein C3K47_15970 [Solitalea longa]
MYKTFTKHFSAILTILFFGLNAFAQDDVVNIIKAKDDAGKLAQAYLNPFLKGFGTGLNSGWFQTAKTHGLGRFDITITPSVSFVPSSGRSFNLNELGLSPNIKFSPENSTSPTAMGKSNEGPMVSLMGKHPVSGNDVVLSQFNLPQGAGISFAPAPMAQVSVGLIKGTEVAVRFIPTVNMGNAGTVNLIGFGLKHDIKQWIPVIKMLPFDLSVMAGFTNLKYKKELELNPDAGALPKSQSFDASSADQRIEFTSKGFMANAIISKKISVLTVFGAVGYQSTKSEVGMYGKYPVTTAVNAAGTPTYEILVNPIGFSNNDSNGANLTGGFRLKFAVFTVHASGTLAKYPTANAGFGLNLDWK